MDFLFIVTPIVGVCNCSMFCCTLLYVHSSIAIILMGKRELIALLYLSSWCLVMVERLFLAVPRGCLQFVIVVFPDHTHLLFLNNDVARTLKRYAHQREATVSSNDSLKLHPFSKWKRLQKERICSQRARILLFKSSSLRYGKSLLPHKVSSF